MGYWSFVLRLFSPLASAAFFVCRLSEVGLSFKHSYASTNTATLVSWCFVVLLVDFSGSGKTTATSKVVGSTKLLAMFSDGVVRLTVNLNKRLPFLMRHQVHRLYVVQREYRPSRSVARFLAQATGLKNYSSSLLP